MLQFAALFLVIGALADGAKDAAVAWKALAIMAVSVIGRIIMTYFSVMEQTETGYCMVAEKRIRIGDKLRYIPMEYFNKSSIGNITAVVTTTLANVENSAASVLVYLATTELAVHKSTALSSARQHTQESLVEFVLEYVHGMGIVKAFGAEKNSTQSVTGAIRESCRNNLKLTYACVPYDALKQIVVRVFSFLLLLVSVSFYINGTLSLTYSLLMVIASFLVFNDLEGAGNMASLLQMLAASMDTVNAMEDMPVMDEKGSNVAVKDNNIVFDNVKFSYADRKILDGVSFTIPEKTTTAIVGPSGAGKTTMCNLIARSWDVDGGKESMLS